MNEYIKTEIRHHIWLYKNCLDETLDNKKSHQLSENVKKFSDFQTRIRHCRRLL